MSGAAGGRGRLIALDGVDGAGKSTQVGLLRARLEERGRDVVTVREPGGTALGEQVRSILLDPTTPLEAEAELLLFLASRVQLYEEVIRPALADGAVVVTDRFHLSTLVYQGIARGLGEAHTARVLTAVLEDRRPHLNVILTLPLDVCLERLPGARGTGRADRFESEPELLRRVADGYDRTVGLAGDVIVRVDGVGEPQSVGERVWERVRDAL